MASKCKEDTGGFGLNNVKSDTKLDNHEKIKEQLKTYESGGFGTSLSSNRQHLSYDVCLEVRGKIIRTVPCRIVY